MIPQRLCAVMDGSETQHGARSTMHMNIESLCCAPETNTILFLNHTSVTTICQLCITTLLHAGLCAALRDALRYVCPDGDTSVGQVNRQAQWAHICITASTCDRGDISARRRRVWTKGF